MTRTHVRRFVPIAVVALLLAAVTFPLWRPLFVNDVIDEAFPNLSLEQRQMMDAMPQAEREAFIAMSETDGAMAQAMVEAALSPDSTADEAMPEMPAEPVVYAAGQFVGMDAIHQGSGSATIYQLEDGSRVLRFDDFRVTNGPDLHVLLARTAAPTDRASLGEDYLNLGRLKGNVGSQNYEIGADVDLSQYQSVVIYCLPFHVVFSTVTLTVTTG
jgi:Electron transfer DM13